MIFLFEQFPYSMEYLKSVLPLDKEGRFKDLPNGFVTRDGKLDGVGYLFNGSRLGGRDDKKDGSRGTPKSREQHEHSCSYCRDAWECACTTPIVCKAKNFLAEP